MNSQREPGYYWVRFLEEHKWTIAEYLPSYFHEEGYTWRTFGLAFLRLDSDFSEIDERRIIRPGEEK